MRDAYFAEIGVLWHTICMNDLLTVIADKWYTLFDFEGRGNGKTKMN